MNLLERFNNWRRDNPLYGEQVRAWLRLAFLVVSIPAIAMLGMWFFEGANPFEIARSIREVSIWTKLIPRWLALLLTPFTAWNYARYLMAPLGAFLLVLLSGALYVQDIYALDSFLSALRYVFSSLFGLTYPRLQIDGGKKLVRPGEINTLDKIGGPGFALVQPGNAVLFKKMHVPSQISLPSRYFMTPFEIVGSIVDMTDQEGYQEDAWAVTLDGIQLHLRDIRFSYRLLPVAGNGNGPVRSLQDPYPFPEDSLFDSVFNLSAGDSWQSAVERIVVGEINAFISNHRIDYLTAPRQFGLDPRRELRTHLFTPGIQKRLKNVGAELMWVDVGHLDIVELSQDKHENVDGQRLDYWASRWIGEVRRTQAIGEAKRIAYQERGRVDAQAAFLKSVTDALRGFDLTDNPPENLRRLLLLRTAQILEGMASHLPGRKESK